MATIKTRLTARLERIPDEDELGPHTTGKSCVYVKRLDQIDQNVLEQLIHKAWESSAHHD